MRITIFILTLIIPSLLLCSGFLGFGYFSTGISAFNVSALNEALKAHGYEELSENRFVLGGGGYTILWKRLLLGGEGFGCIPTKIENDMNKGNITMGYGYGSIGFAPINTNHFMLAPIVGFGGYGIIMHLIPKNIIGNFDDFLSNPARMSVLRTSGVMTTVQGKMAFFFSPAKNKEQGGGIEFGATFGYNWALTKGGWKIEDFDVADSPKTNLGGFFIHLECGGFGPRNWTL